MSAGVRTPGFGIGDVDTVVLRDRDAARPPELPPLLEKLAALIEDLDAIVLAVADEQPAARVDRDGVRLADLAGPRALAPQSRTNFPSWLKRTTRLFFPLRWLSVTNTSPLGATTTSVG